MEAAALETRDRVRMQIPSHPRYIAYTRDSVYRLARMYGFKPAHALDLKIIIGEALSNIIKHAYENRTDQPVFLEILMFNNYIEIRLRDLGKQVPVTANHASDLSDYRERGLGVYIISVLADYHFYDQSEKVGTTLVVKKRLEK